MAIRELSCSLAMAEALKEEMERAETVFILGEDLVAHGGIFGQFRGLPELFPDRIIDTPISETSIVGAGVGAALTGMRPIIDMHFADFVTTAMDCQPDGKDTVYVWRTSQPSSGALGAGWWRDQCGCPAFPVFGKLDGSHPRT